MAHRNDWISERIDGLGKTKIGLAEQLGISAARVSELIGGRRQVKSGEIPKMARYLEMTEVEVIVRLGGASPATANPAVGDVDLLPVGLRRVMVRGEVQAGAWVEAYEFPEAEWYPVTVPESKYDHLPQFALKVRGPSMDLVYPEGSVVICVPFAALRRQPRNGERVVVERHRDGLVEATIKEIEINGNGTVRLWPRSSSPRFKDPIELPASHLPWGLAEGPVSLYQAAPDMQMEPEAEIHVTALVIGSFRWEG